MPAPKQIKILPELADYLDPLDPVTFEQLKAQIARDGLTDPVCYATLTLPGGTVNAPLDGHHRLRACKEVGAPVKWRLIESVRTLEEAKAWMFQRQDGRRNWSPNRRAMHIAEAYEAAKIERGRRTDLLGGGKVDTALAIGKQFGVSDKTVTDAAQLHQAIEILTDTLGVDARRQLLSHNPPAGRDTLIDLAKAPEHLHRDAWQRLLKRDVDGVRAILGRGKRPDVHQPPGLGGKAERQPAAMELYPLPDLVRLIGIKWPVERLEGWQPTYVEGEVLELHAEAALRSLIWLAEKYDWGQAALDDYRAEHAQDAQDAADPEPADAPEAAPEAPRADLDAVRQRMREAIDKGEDAIAGVNRAEAEVAQAAQAPRQDAPDSEEEEDYPTTEAAIAPAPASTDPEAIRQRLNDRLADRGMGTTGVVAAAAAIGISYPALKRFRDGQGTRAQTVQRIAAWLEAAS